MKIEKTRKLVAIAIFTAIVVVLQFLGSVIRFGPFSVSLTLIPIVIGAALYGPWVGAWLGFVFSLIVLVSGDAAPFLAVNVIGTLLTVVIKGTVAGLCAGLVYEAVEKNSSIVAAVLSAITCPLVNTGIFLVGCYLFFMPLITTWSSGLGYDNVGMYMIVGLVGLNFLFEVLVNIILSPAIIRLIKYAKSKS